MAWQPIETAPTRDGNVEIDMWENGQRRTNCFWGRPTYGPQNEQWCRYAYDDSDGPVFMAVKGATHWMPLPEPPEDRP